MESNTFDISGRVDIHDVHQFEVKLEYNLEELQEVNNYGIESYFFIPRALNINRYTYQKEQFYRDLNNYIRFKTPSYSFKLILDPDFERSPLFVLEKLSEELEAAKLTPDKENLFLPKKEKYQKTIKELKLLGCMVLARLRDYEGFIDRKLVKLTERDTDYLLTRLDNSVMNGIRILNELRRLKTKFESLLDENNDIRKYFRIVEEFLSYLLEEEMIPIIKKVKSAMPDCPGLLDIEMFFRTFLTSEQETRRENGFHLIFARDDRGKENYIYQLSQYKKVISSILFLGTNRETQDLAFIHLIGSIAAFLASMLYFYITYLVSSKVSIDSFMFVFLISIGYVFKDRIKEIIKAILSPNQSLALPDNTTEILDVGENDHCKLGKIKETVIFADRNKIDPVVLDLRNRHFKEVLPEESPEEIMVFHKDIYIDTEAVINNHSRTVNFTDIMRFNIQQYLQRMDDPEQSVYYYDPDLEKEAKTIGRKIYYIHLVLKFSEVKEEMLMTRYEIYRIAANKYGIQRIESLEMK
ncbi:MAG: hypothetical protein LWY06_09900 [Firmicutes bacterium]|nr:hypothetical protein [Bacillota bacterium]